jgi:hypothetical protein
VIPYVSSEAWRRAQEANAATLVFVDHPFEVSARNASRVALAAASGAPVRVRDIVEPICRSYPGHRMTVQVNGAYHLPSMGARVIAVGDIIVVTDETLGGGGGDSFKALANIALTIALAIATGGASLIFQIGAQLVGHLLLNALLNNLIPSQDKSGSQGPQSPSPTYNFAIQGNQLAQQGEPIAVQYGFVRSYPKFAAQPYVEYVADEQFYYALLEIGQGEYAVSRTEIDDTDIAHFDDIQARVVAPGETPVWVLANVVTAPEVGDQDLETGVYVGGLNVCGPGLRVQAVGFDVTLAGLGELGSGDPANHSVSIKFQIRAVDDYGRAIGAGVWTDLATETITAATTSAVRRSFKYDVGTAQFRPQVRAVRTDVKDERNGVLNSPKWSGLRGYLAEPAPLAATATYVEVKAKASAQLNGLSQRKIAVFAMRKIKTWNPDTGWSPAAVESRSIPWAIADVLTNSVYGKGLPDSRIDLQTFYDLDVLYQARQDRFDFVFDAITTAEAAANLVAKAGRAVCMPRAGVWTLMRDQQQTLPVAMFTPRNMVGDGGRSTFKMPILLPREETPDGVLVEYYDNKVWDWRQILVPMPGLNASQVRQPVVERIPGIGGVMHATREGRYLASDTFYRRCFPQWTATRDGNLPAYGSLVLVGHDLPKWGAYGDVVDWDEDALTMSLSEMIDWGTGGQHYIRLQRPNGTAHPAILCEQGTSADTAFLAEAPDFTPIFSAAEKERTKFSIGTATEKAMDCRVKSLIPRGRGIIDMVTVLEDDRVHTADNDLLPAGSEIQDPIDNLPGSDEGSDLPIVNLSSHSMDALSTEGTIAASAWLFKNDGSMELGGSTSDFCPGEWLLSHPVSTTVTALFEMRVTLLSGAVDGGSSPLGVWQACTATRTYTVSTSGLPETKDCTLLVEVRDAATQTLQDSTTISLSATTIHIDGG